MAHSSYTWAPGPELGSLPGVGVGVPSIRSPLGARRPSVESGSQGQSLGLQLAHPTGASPEPKRHDPMLVPGRVLVPPTAL